MLSIPPPSQTRPRSRTRRFVRSDPGNPSSVVAGGGAGMPMELVFGSSEHEGWNVLSVTGEVDAYTSPMLRDRLSRIMAGGQYRIVVDLEGVGFMDSTGLGVLVSALK